MSETEKYIENWVCEIHDVYLYQEDVENYVRQIISDTKKACKREVDIHRETIDTTGTLLDTRIKYFAGLDGAKEAIEKAEVTGE